MLRKLALALVPVVSLAAPASAHGSPGGHGGHFGGHFGGHHFRHFGHHFHGHRFFRAGYVGDPCYRTVFTEFGPRTIDICE
jgi:hypothetical protein